MAKTVRVKWIEKKQFIGTDETKHSVVLSGSGPEDNVGMNPSQLLLISLGGCTSYDVVDILQKKRQKLTGLEVLITGDQEADPPWPYRNIHVHYVVRGKGLREKAVKDAIELSEGKYCSVAATVCTTADVTYDYEIIEDEA